MGLYKVTYKEDKDRINIYNNVCNMNCKICALKLKNNRKARKYLEFKEIIEIIEYYQPKIVNFIGGEPTANPLVINLITYIKNKYKNMAITIGHSNGSKLPPLNIDKISISIKAYDDLKHRELTGMTNEDILRNFKILYNAGVELSASSIYIPEYIDNIEIEKISKFISEIDNTIPYHIIGYIQVPGCEWRRPTPNEMEIAVNTALKYLKTVTYSLLSPREALTLPKWDSRYKSKVIIQLA